MEQIHFSESNSSFVQKKKKRWEILVLEKGFSYHGKWNDIETILSKLRASKTNHLKSSNTSRDDNIQPLQNQKFGKASYMSSIT